LSERIDQYLPQDRMPTAIDRFLRSRAFLIAIVALLVVTPLLLIPVVYLLREPLMQLLVSQFWFSVIMIAVSLFVILQMCPVCILAERKLSAWVQDRMGPNRVGYWGVLQPLADGIKFILKEDITPANVDKPVFILAPAMAMTIAMVGFAVIPWAGVIQWPWAEPGHLVTTQVASIDVGLLYMVAFGSMGVYGVVLAGWASNNKYSFYGGMRAAAQMLSYEVPLGLGILIVLLVAGTLRLEDIVNQQATAGVWNVFLHPIAFLIVLITAFAETNRAPFDLAECEQELIAGFHTEYSSMKFAMFFLGEYTHMMISSALIIALFLGGWAPLPFLSFYSESAPGVIEATWWNTGWMAALIKFGVYWGKISAFIAFFMLIRWTLPRFRFDQLMRLAWKGLVPMGVALVIATGVLVALGLNRNLIASLAVNAIVLAVALWIASRGTTPITGRQDNLPEVDVVGSRLKGMAGAR